MRFKPLLATISAALVMVPPALAQDLASPEGIWEIDSRDSRYQVELCGDDGQSLCGTLVWLAESAQSEENLQYMNSTIIDHAEPTGENSWNGRLSLWGQSANGTITQVSDDTIELEGCAFIVVCRTYTLNRYSDV
ncbi:DUF2147 domain-containing protein [Pelagibacterium luteolum]|uniref:Uncharacterized conserved protein, DUF2147 family n=1 Tax=Pelagibacterium luteolum TaxID=440168 RepID=A0A1G7WPT9_9HYPH|nr:DUF2147 domain-containing protein [Pelagibacterium luteolum]SDG73914.1 Uncharacterized conserved protein, DUF2147 family [Pelagibacterium luteolum]